MAHIAAKGQVVGQYGSCDKGKNDGGLLVATVRMDFINEPEVEMCDTKHELLLELTGQRTGNDKVGGDIVMLLDVGGGILGDKLKVMKQAIQTVINRLTPSDCLSVIITFPTDSKKKFDLSHFVTSKPNKAQNLELKYMVQNYKEGANENIIAALQMASNDLEHRTNNNGGSGAIILMSDGIQNNFGTYATNIRLGRFPIYTFCLGRNNSRVLKDIAARSNGGKFNLVVPGKLTDMLTKCLNAILSVPVHDVTLVLKPLTSAVKKNEKVTTKISNVYAGLYTQSRDDNATVTVSFGNLYRQEKRGAIIDLSLPAVSDEVDINALQMFCHYRDRTGKLAQTNPIIFRVKRRSEPNVDKEYADLVEQVKQELKRR